MQWCTHAHTRTDLSTIFQVQVARLAALFMVSVNYCSVKFSTWPDIPLDDIQNQNIIFLSTSLYHARVKGCHCFMSAVPDLNSITFDLTSVFRVKMLFSWFVLVLILFCSIWESLASSFTGPPQTLERSLFPVLWYYYSYQQKYLRDVLFNKITAEWGFCLSF